MDECDGSIPSSPARIDFSAPPDRSAFRRRGPTNSGSLVLRIIQSISALLGVSVGQVGINPCSILQVAFTMMSQQQPGFTLATNVPGLYQPALYCNRLQRREFLRLSPSYRLRATNKTAART